MGKVVKNDWTVNVNGSVYAASGSSALTPDTGNVFVAISFLTDTVFDSASGLVAENATSYINTEGIGAGSNGAVVDSVTFPAGMTIYGRWTKIDLNSGKVIAYIG